MGLGAQFAQQYYSLRSNTVEPTFKIIARKRDTTIPNSAFRIPNSEFVRSTNSGLSVSYEIIMDMDIVLSK